MNDNAFSELFVSGSYSLPEDQKVESAVHLSDSEESYVSPEYEPIPKAGCLPADGDSVCGSEKEGISTATTATPSTKGRSALLAKRSPAKALKLPTSEQAAFVELVFGPDLLADKAVALAIQILDRRGEVSEIEWNSLPDLERKALAAYVFPLCGVPLPASLDTPRSLNALLERKPVPKRNEEKLNKVAKLVNGHLASGFCRLNELEELGQTEQTQILGEAYFGPLPADSRAVSVFDPKTTFSQKSFAVLAACPKYAADFQAVMLQSLVSEFESKRLNRVRREVKRLRKQLAEGELHHVQAEHNKRSPWTLDDILEGVQLCQSIIKKKYPF